VPDGSRASDPIHLSPTRRWIGVGFQQVVDGDYATIVGRARKPRELQRKSISWIGFRGPDAGSPAYTRRSLLAK